MLAEDGWTSAQVEVIELAVEPEPTDYAVEARIARLESDMSHVRTDVADIKIDIRARFDKVDARLDRLDTKIDALEDSLASAKVWALIVAGGVLGVMARGFGWI